MKPGRRLSGWEREESFCERRNDFCGQEPLGGLKVEDDKERKERWDGKKGD